MIRSEVNAFWRFVNERQEVYLRKEAGGKSPLTKDPILSKYRFPNVYRSQDPGTTWLREELAENPPHSVHELLFMVTVFRLVNWAPTLATLGIPRNFIDLDAWLARYQELREQSTERVSRNVHSKTIDTLSYGVVMPFSTAIRVSLAEDGYEAWQRLLDVRGLGPYFALQVLADFLADPKSHLDPDTIVPTTISSRIACDRIRSGKITQPSDVYGKPVPRSELDVLEHLHANQVLTAGSCQPLTYVDLEQALSGFERYRSLQEGRGNRPQLYR